MTSSEFNEDQLRRELHGLPTPAGLAAENIDVAAVSHRVNRGMVRRSNLQKVGVGALALAVVGGLGAGMVHMFKQTGTSGVLVASPVTTEITCGATYVPFQPHDVPPYLDILATTDSASSPLNATGERPKPIGYGDFNTWLVNPLNGEDFNAGSTGYTSAIVVRDSKIIAVPGAMPQPWTDHNLAPGQEQQVGSPVADLCEGESYGKAGKDELYIMLDTTTPDGINKRIWGGPFTFSEELSNPWPEAPQDDPDAGVSYEPEQPEQNEDAPDSLGN